MGVSRHAGRILTLLVLAGLVLLNPCSSQGQPAGQARPDVAFFASLERLIDRFGTQPDRWPSGPDKTEVTHYLKTVHGLDLADITFARNLLGLGVGNSPDQADKDLSQGATDGWGVPYDLVLASSRGSSKEWDLLQGIFINQGMGMFNPDLSEKNYVVLKADLHSQFGDVFKNFNGISARILAREVNFLGSPGSAAEDYPDQIRPALTAADAVRATIYTCDDDKIPMIIPKVFNEMAESMGIKLPMMAAPRRPMGPMKQVEIRRVELDHCAHELKEYQTQMKTKGTTLLKPKTTI